MTTNSYPSLEEFLAAPVEEVAKVAPATLILAAGGTRRSAVMAGISTESKDYPQRTRQEMIACFDLIFRHGIRHIFTAVMTDINHSEVTKGYRAQLLTWVDWGVAGPEALADYARFGWQVRLVGIERLPELNPTAERLQKTASHTNAPTVWFTVASQAETPWELLLETAQKKKVYTRKELIRAIYGEDIPLATLYLGFGKPEVYATLVPPLLIGKMQCYWRQDFAYKINEKKFRTILYDYAYLRRTWKKDKTGRAEKVLNYRMAWQNPPVIGLGTRLGPFWYPASISAPEMKQDTKI